jgi:PE-PPE domain
VGASDVAKHAVKHRKRKNPTRRAIKAPAVSMAALLAGGLVLAPQPHTAASAAPTAHEDVLLAAATIVYIDGHDYPDSGTRMAQQLAGINQFDPNCAATCTHLTSAAGANQLFVQYPAKLGLLDGPGAPTGDQSINAGQAGIHSAILASNPSANPVTVVGYSEGAVAASHEVPNWTPGGPVSFVLIADAERPNGGILSRFPAGTYIPFIGITAGNATSSTGGPVVMVTRQYDGIADAPAYPVNVLADANAVLGFYYLHGNYQSVNPNDPNTAKIVTTSPNGNMTDILILAPPGQLPILMPLAQAGVPQPILVALDPATRAIIETGYDRTSDPSQQVRFALLPPVSAWPGDAQMVVVGFVATAQLLPGALIASAPGALALPAVAPLTTITPPAQIGTALAAMPGPIQQGENNPLTGVSSAGTAWTPVSSPVFSSAPLPQQQSVNGPTTLVANISPAPPPSGNPPADPPSTPAPSIAGPITGALTNPVTNLSPFAIANGLAPNGAPNTANLGGGTANTANSPGGNLVNTVAGTVTGVTGAVGGALGGLKSALSGQHNQ